MQTDNRENRENQTQDAENIKKTIERDLANYTATKLAIENNDLEKQRDQAMDLVAAQAEQRTLAEQQAAAAATVAAVEASQRTAAEQEAVAARLSEERARQEASHLATERSLLRENLAAEREAASNASFGFVFMVCIVLAALIGLGIWYYTSNNPAGSAAGNNLDNNRTVMQTSAPAAGQNAANEKTNTVIVRDNPSLVVVPVTPATTEANRARSQAAATTAGSAVESAPPVEAPETPPPDASDSATESQNDSAAGNPNQEGTGDSSE